MRNVLELINLASSARNFIGTQFSYLRENGDYKMHLICTPDEKIEQFAVEQGINYSPVTIKRQISVVSDARALFYICKYIKQNKIEVVIAHQAKARLLGMLACFLTGVPHRIIFAHGVLYETMHGVKRLLIKLNDCFVSLLSDKVVCVSKYVSDCRERDHIDKKCKRIVLGHGSCNGIDTINQFNPAIYSDSQIQNLKSSLGLSDADYIIGFCGRLVRDKGVIELIEGYSKLVGIHNNKNIKLLIIGTPEIRDGLPPETISYIKNSKDIVFSGSIQYEIIALYYLMMDVFILPSHREGLGMVALEAAAMERPVLVTSITGCRETIIPDITGSYVDLNADSICEELEKYMDNEYAQKQGAEGRKFVIANFERQIVNGQMLNFLNNVCNDGKK